MELPARAAPLEHLGREPGHVEDGLSRPALLDVPAKLPTIHPGHLDVGKDEMNAARVLLDSGDRFPAVTRLERLIAGPGQHPAGQTPDSLFIIDDQDRITAGRSPGRSRVGTGRALRYRHVPVRSESSQAMRKYPQAGLTRKLSICPPEESRRAGG